MYRFLALIIVFFAVLPAYAQNCGPENPCEIDGGSYHLRLPDGDGPHPVLIWYHGFRGNGASIHRSQGLEQDFLDNGYALLAPNGLQRSGDGARFFAGRDGAPRDDIEFTYKALADALKRAPLDISRVFAGGFSAGGSMAWLLACETGERLSGMVSVAGALRRPNKTQCSGLKGLPVMQVHGFADKQVPLEGRQIRDWHQGSVWVSLDRARIANECRSNPDEISSNEIFMSRIWGKSCAKAPVHLHIHSGGHGLPKGWTTSAYSFFETFGRTVN